MIKKFEELLLSTKREGIEALLEFIRKSDFYTAPASTKYHSCHEGGLLEHSLNVYKCLKEKENNTMWTEVYKDIPEEIEKLKALMKVVSGQLDFEQAIEIREKIAFLKAKLRKVQR